MIVTLGEVNGNRASLSFEDSAWLTVDLGPYRPSASVYLRRTDEGFVIDVFPLDGEADEPIGSTYVFDSELTDAE